MKVKRPHIGTNESKAQAMRDIAKDKDCKKYAAMLHGRVPTDAKKFSEFINIEINE